MNLTHYNTEEFQVKLSLDKPYDKSIEQNLIHLRSGSGFPVYNSYYVDLEKYIINKVSYFNNNLRKHFVVNGSRSSGVLDIKDQTMKHYSERFPEGQFKVSPGDLFLKPACCATAFKIWKSKGVSLRKKQIIHEVSDCYRVENTGTTRSFRRNCYFTMPDYHMITTNEDFLQDFVKIRSYLFEFYESILGSSWKKDFIQIIRVNEESYRKYGNFINTLEDLELDTIINHVSWESSKPYFQLKYEISYRNGPKLITLGTIQIDYLYPEIFELDSEKLRPCLHFSQGSIGRILDVLIREEKLPEKGVKILGLEEETLKIIEDLGLKCALLIEDTTTSVKRALSMGFYQRMFFPKLIIIGKNQIKTGTVSVMDRKTKKNTKLNVTELKDIINNDMFLMESNQIHYKSTFCN